MRQTLFIKTTDDVEIAADYYPVEKSIRGAVLIHMMPETRQSFRICAEKLQARGISALAIDLRGHGDSIRGPQGKTLDYKTFSDTDHQQSIRDLEAGIQFLRTKGISDIYLIGASIGANLALQALAEDSALRGAVVLSPGYNYRGIETLPLVMRLHSGQRVLFAASRDDMRGSGRAADEMAQGLFKNVPDGVLKEIKIFDAARHGTTIFEREPQFMEKGVAWIQKGP